MITPIEEPQEEQDDVVVSAIEVEDTPSFTSTESNNKFDFAVDDTDRSDLMVYTVSTKPGGEESKTLTILAPNYGAALDMAGISKDATVKVNEVPFEG